MIPTICWEDELRDVIKTEKIKLVLLSRWNARRVAQLQAGEPLSNLNADEALRSESVTLCGAIVAVYDVLDGDEVCLLP